MCFCEILLDHLTRAFLCYQGYLINTMSFVDALPSLRARQWQLMVLVLLDALSIHRLPALAPITSNYKLMHMVLHDDTFP
jgi:hypothetical protein